MKFIRFVSSRLLIAMVFILVSPHVGMTQITTSSSADGFGVNAFLYAGESFPGTASGTFDWFTNASNGEGNIILQDAATTTDIQSRLSNMSLANPVYMLRQEVAINSIFSIGSVSRTFIDAVFARDHFGGSGAVDSTSFSTASKNAQDPAIWGTGVSNVLGKNDVIDGGGHMFRVQDGSKNNLWFVGLINRAEPGGDAYMDFEFFIRDITYNRTTRKMTTGGPDMGHTSFKFNQSTGAITQLGDMIYNVFLTGGGSTTNVEVRIWVSRADFDRFKAGNNADLPFNFGDLYDGAVNGAPFGYANITIKGTATPSDITGYVNNASQLPTVPPWGSRNTKSNIYLSQGETYLPYSITEMGLNLSALGLDSELVKQADRCAFPWLTFMIKTRASGSFTSALKDFSGPYTWGKAYVEIRGQNINLNCTQPTATLSAYPNLAGATFQWTTSDGNIVGSTTSGSVTVNKPGTYYVTMTTALGCAFTSGAFTVTATQPLISSATATSTISCFGANTGGISLSVSGGTANYTYNWSGPTVISQETVSQTSRSYSNLAPGTYSVTVTDANTCSITQSVVVAEAPQILATGVVTNVACFGNSSGSIVLNSVTGASPFTYAWSDGKTTKDLLNVAAGNYTVTITDANGCTAQFNYTVTQPAAALAATLTKINDTNPDPSIGTGSITLDVSGGTSPYTYSWSGPSSFSSTSKDISNLKYGSYSVTITDANGCTLVKQTFVLEPEICFDGIDNDGDGLTDCADSDCVVAQPVIATFSGEPCVGDPVTYSVSNTLSHNDPIATYSYTWTVPANASITNGQGTATITVNWTAAAPGQVCVTAVASSANTSLTGSGSCSSTKTCYNVSPSDAPVTPSAILKEE